MPVEHRCSALAQFFQSFPDNDTATARVELVRGPELPACPRCGSCDIQHPDRQGRMNHHCLSCSMRFNVRTGTVPEAMYLGMRACEISRYLREVRNCHANECCARRRSRRRPAYRVLTRHGQAGECGRRLRPAFATISVRSALH